MFFSDNGRSTHADSNIFYNTLAKITIIYKQSITHCLIFCNFARISKKQEKAIKWIGFVI